MTFQQHLTLFVSLSLKFVPHFASKTQYSPCFPTILLATASQYLADSSSMISYSWATAQSLYVLFRICTHVMISSRSHGSKYHLYPASPVWNSTLYIQPHSCYFHFEVLMDTSKLTHAKPNFWLLSTPKFVSVKISVLNNDKSRLLPFQVDTVGIHHDFSFSSYPTMTARKFFAFTWKLYLESGHCSPPVLWLPCIISDLDY